MRIPLASAFVLLCCSGTGAQELPFRRADANDDGRLDIGDPIFSLGFIFAAGAAPPCLDGADSNDDGGVDISDAVFTLLYLFGGRTPPPAPGPEDCGVDATPDDLTCAFYECGTTGPGDGLDTALGCTGVYNPEQILEYHLTLSPGDWQSLVADTTNSIYFQAGFRCGGSAPITVGLRRKRSGGADKVGLKLDTNRYVEDQEYHGLHKLSFENGISEGDSVSSIRALMTEYLAWRLMVLSGAHCGRAVFAKLFVNGESLGVYVNVEQVDKVFLGSRLGDSSGWLYKKSGGDDGWKTNEGIEDPYASYFCFWGNGGSACAPPSDGELLSSLPDHLDIDQMLRVGAVNALIGNADGPLVKDNNYYFYDWAGGPRVYLPWDLDTVMKQRPHVFTGLAAKYTDVLFTHWEEDYDEVVGDLLSTRLRLETILGEIDRAVRVAGPELDGDPHLAGDSAAATAAEIGGWWTARHAEASAQVASH